MSTAHDVIKLIFAVLSTTQRRALHVVVQRQFFNIYINFAVFPISIRSWDTATSTVRKQTDAIWKFYFRIWFWAFYRDRHVILHRRAKFSSELDDKLRLRTPPAPLGWCQRAQCSEDT